MGLKRTVHPDTLAALSQPYFHPVVLVHVDWPDDPVRVHSGRGTLTWGGHDWMGVGPMGGALDLPADALGIAMVAGRLALGGLPDDIDDIIAACPEAVGRAVQVYFGCVTEAAGTTLIGAPFEATTCQIGAATFTEALSGTVINRLMDVSIVTGPSARSTGAATHTLQDQQLRDPDDTAGRWVQWDVIQKTIAAQVLW